MKHTAHSLTIKHKKRKSAQFEKNRREEELEDKGKAKHYKHEKRHKSAETMCKHCKSASHSTHEHYKHEKHHKKAGKPMMMPPQQPGQPMMMQKHSKKKKAAMKLQTANARYENMRRKVFGLKS